MNFSKKIKTFLVPFFVLMSINTFAQNYQPNWESLDKRHTPQWYAQAKFGIFLHWGIYSVPAWATNSNADWQQLCRMVLAAFVCTQFKNTQRVCGIS